MQPVMLEEMEVLNLTFNAWQNFSPIRIKESLSPEYRSSFFLVEVTNQGHVAYGMIGSVPIKNILGGQIHCHEKIFPNQLEILQRELSRELVQKNPIILIAELDSIWNFSPSVVDEFKCIKSARTKNEQNLRLFELPEEKKVDLSMIPLCLADGHHRYHAFKNLMASQKNWERSSLAAAVFPASGVVTSRKKVVFLEEDFPFPLFFYFLRKNSLVKESHRNSECKGIKLLFQGKWYEIPILYQDYSMFSHLFLLELLKESKINTPFSLMPETHFSQLEEEMESNGVEGLILPPDDPKSVMKMAFEGKILEANSTFFKPKFPDNLVTHRIIE